jgi:hypothetical protein
MLSWFLASHLVTQLAGGGLLKLFFGNLVNDWEAFVGFLRAHSIWLTVSLCLSLAWGVDHIICHRHAAHVEKQLSDANAALTKERNGRIADRQAYVKAQADAAAQNKAQVAKVEQQYQRNSDDERQAYLSDLAKLRADRVRQQASAAPGSTGATGSPQAPAPAAGANGNGLCVPAESALCEAGAEIELRLMHLQNLYDQQTKVDPNTEAAH